MTPQEIKELAHEEALDKLAHEVDEHFGTVVVTRHSRIWLLEFTTRFLAAYFAEQKPVAWYPVDEEGLRLGDNISFCSSVPIPTKGFSLGFSKAIPLFTAPAPQQKKEYAWECNECGSQEYTMSVSEDDVNHLGCGSCGGDEWHKAEVKK